MADLIDREAVLPILAGIARTQGEYDARDNSSNNNNSNNNNGGQMPPFDFSQMANMMGLFGN